MLFFYVYLYLHTESKKPTLSVGREHEFGNEECHTTYEKMLQRVEDIISMTNGDVDLEWIIKEQNFTPVYMNLKELKGGIEEALRTLNDTILYDYNTKDLEWALRLNGFTKEQITQEIKDKMYEFNISKEEAQIQVALSHQLENDYKDLMIELYRQLSTSLKK